MCLIQKHDMQKYALTSIPRITTSRREVIHLLNRMMQYVNTRTEINAEKYPPVLKKIAMVILGLMNPQNQKRGQQNESAEMRMT